MSEVEGNASTHMKHISHYFFPLLLIYYFDGDNNAFGCSTLYDGPYSGSAAGITGGGVVDIVVNSDGSASFITYDQRIGLHSFAGTCDLNNGTVNFQGTYTDPGNGGGPFQNTVVVSGNLTLQQNGSIVGAGSAHSPVTGHTYSWSVASIGMQELIPALEYGTLADIYKYTGGETWRYNCGWLNPNASHWNNVEVDGWAFDVNGTFVPGNVTGLFLSNNNLVGLFPTGLEKFSQLLFLSLGENQLVGNIPAEVGDLSMLQYLDLSANQLTGDIPESIWRLIEINYIDLSNNQLSGNLSFSVANGSKLESLNVANNNLTGDIPDLSGIQPLQVFNVTNNWLNIAIGSQSAMNASSMENAGIGVDYIPQGMGIDFDKSVYRSLSDFINLRKQGFHFAIVQGWGGGSINARANSQLQNARNAGMLTAGYCLLNYTTAYDGAAQVDYALEAFGSESSSLGFIAIDVEINTMYPTFYPISFLGTQPNPSDQVAAIIRIKQAVERVRNLGLQPVIYSNPSAWTTITGPDSVDFAGVKLWDWKISPSTTNNITIPIVNYGGWTSRVGKQYQQDIVLSNPNIKVDLDVFDLSAFSSPLKFSYRSLERPLSLKTIGNQAQ